MKAKKPTLKQHNVIVDNLRVALSLLNERLHQKDAEILALNKAQLAKKIEKEDVKVKLLMALGQVIESAARTVDNLSVL